jgi:hypothetical protein
MRTIQAGAVLVIAVFLSGAGADCKPPVSAPLLRITPYAQQTSNWCWAATGQITMNYVRPGSVPRQCEAVSKVVSNRDGVDTDCCKKEPPNNEPPKKCLVTNDSPAYAENGFEAIATSKNLRVAAEDRALSWEEIKQQIYCKKKPFAFSWRFAASRYASGHMMVAMGYEEKSGEKLVHFFNPSPRNPSEEPVDEEDRFSYRTYEEYVKGGGYVHGQAFYDISFKGGD